MTLTHGNMTFVADSIIEYLEMRRTTASCCVLPLSFGYGLYQLLMCVRVGATLVLEPGFGFPGRVVEMLEEQRITGLPGVPTVFAGAALAARACASGSCRTCATSPTPAPRLPAATIAGDARDLPRRAAVLHVRADRVQARLLPAAGGARRASPASVGIAIPGTEAWVEDEDGDVPRPGEVGELMVRGAHVMQGYWGDPEATAERLRPGRWPWERVLATGDLFRADEDGYLYFVGRRDDIIKSRGEKVAPREVEEVPALVSRVARRRSSGSPIGSLGEAVHAHVSRSRGPSSSPTRCGGTARSIWRTSWSPSG